MLVSLPLLSSLARRPLPARIPAVHYRVCPECSGLIVPASGCVTCVACGWGRCG